MTMYAKYRLNPDRKIELGENQANRKKKTLYGIISLVEIPKHGVRTGDSGGYVESEANLSHIGSCWIAENAIVMDNAFVGGDAIVSGSSKVTDNAKVNSSARVEGNSVVADEAVIEGHATVLDSIILNEAYISGNSRVVASKIYDTSCVYSNGKVFNSVLSFRAKVSGNAQVQNNSAIKGNVIVSGDCVINKSTIRAEGKGEVSICANCVIQNNSFICAKDNMIFINSPVFLDQATFVRHSSDIQFLDTGYTQITIFLSPPTAEHCPNWRVVVKDVDQEPEFHYLEDFRKELEEIINIHFLSPC